MNVWACMDADDVLTCGSCADGHLANMQNKIGTGYDYKMEMVCLFKLPAVNTQIYCMTWQWCNEEK